MSNMKCPVCKTGTVKQGKYDKEYYCDNAFCPSYDETDSRTYDILIRTRKALDAAVDALKELKPQKAKGGGYWAVKSTDSIKLINTTLEQITALEQKE